MFVTLKNVQKSSTFTLYIAFVMVVDYISTTITNACIYIDITTIVLCLSRGSLLYFHYTTKIYDISKYKQKVKNQSDLTFDYCIPLNKESN